MMLRFASVEYNILGLCQQWNNETNLKKDSLGWNFP
jgi:hypothetical protein